MVGRVVTESLAKYFGGRNFRKLRPEMKSRQQIIVNDSIVKFGGDEDWEGNKFIQSTGALRSYIEFSLINTTYTKLILYAVSNVRRTYSLHLRT